MSKTFNEIILDIGCGNDKAPDSIGVDKVKLPNVDMVHDIDNIPWPFDDNYADKIIMNMVLEHTNDVIKTMEEAHRVLKAEGLLLIKVPYYKSQAAYGDPTHKHFFTENTFAFFTADHDRNYYTTAKFQILKQTLYRGNASVGEKLRNSLPFKSLLRHFLFGLFDEIHVELKK